MAESKRLVVKTSTVRAAVGDSDLVFHSLEEVPPEIREKLRKAIQGPDSETILIADEMGREQIFQAIARLPAEMQKKVLASIRLTGSARLVSGRAQALRWIVPAAAAALLALWLAWIWLR